MAGRSGKLISINSSGGGVPKRPVLFSAVNSLGLVDDRHVDEHHGGPERAICLYPIEHIRALRAEGHPIDIGTTGENFTVEGLDWSLMVPGTRLAVGPQVRLEVTSFTVPCKTIAGSFTDGLFKRISQKVNPGWSRVYSKVVVPGAIQAGCSIIIE